MAGQQGEASKKIGKYIFIVIDKITSPANSNCIYLIHHHNHRNNEVKCCVNLQTLLNV